MKKSARIAYSRHAEITALIQASGYAGAAAYALAEADTDGECIAMRRSLLETAERSMLKAIALVDAYGFGEAYADRDLPTDLREIQTQRKLAA